MRRILDLLLYVWAVLTRPAAYLSLGFLTIGGFVAGCALIKLFGSRQALRAQVTY